MPKLKARRFTGADMLSTVRRESLLQWLTPAKDYFAQRGVMWETRNAECGAQNGMHPSAPLAIGCREGEALGESPDTTGGSPVLPAAEGVIDYEKLASVFMEPDEAMPGYL
ncbi:MAG TPA: hypothetical protein VK846_03315, partial [Candidatus Limnocylindria bacterium]|nr:hypothetical protein [Candidatus Limnocylindria bacterium]